MMDNNEKWYFINNLRWNYINLKGKKQYDANITILNMFKDLGYITGSFRNTLSEKVRLAVDTPHWGYNHILDVQDALCEEFGISYEKLRRK